MNFYNIMNLYKKDSKGKLRYLKVWSEGATIFNESGMVGTDSPIVHTKEAKPKNVGKSNATTAEEQAVFEVNSFITRKLDEGYFKTIEEVENEEVILPMLAKDFSKEKHKIDWNNAYCQPKFDGMRCLAIIKDGTVTLMSRKGKKIENMMHIERELLNFYDGKDFVLDGELYVHGESFQTNMSYVKKYQEGLSERIQFNIYDIIHKIDLGFVDRLFELEQFVEPTIIIANMQHLQVVKTFTINSEEDLKSYHSQFISEGYEGTMIRWGHEPYKINGRSSNLLKYKEFIDIQVPLVDVEPATQRPDWGTPIFDGFKAGVRLTHEQRADLLTNKHDYIGKMAEIRFFEYTDDGLPRFPVLVGFREDK